MGVVLVVGADRDVVAAALDVAGEDGDVIVLDPSPARLVGLVEVVSDPRAWYLLGDAEVMPLPDGSADSVLGAALSPEVERVRR